jgi:imidazolonepropionase-like amidohydrolase
MATRTMTRRGFVAGLAAGGVGLGRSRASLAAAGGRPANEPPIVIADVTVIDATGAPPRPHMTVVVESERIGEIRPANPGRATPGARVIDGAGRFVIPGLWDAHVHTFVFPWQPDRQLPLFVANGITGVRDMGGTMPMTAIDEIRSAIATGTRVGPRIVAGVMVDGPIPVWPFALRAGTAEEGRRAVAEIARAGADFVKVYTLLPRAAYAAIAEAAKEEGIPFLGHVPIATTAAEASDAGQRTIEHFSDSLLVYCSTAEDETLAALRSAASGPDPVQAYGAAFFAALPRLVATFDPAKVEALAARFVANQTWFTPTLTIARAAAIGGTPAQTDDPRLRYLPADVVAGWKAQSALPAEVRTTARGVEDAGAAATRTMRRDGVAVLAGTDVGLPFILPGFSLHDELALLVEAGLTPLEALQAATRDAARAVGLGRQLGTVEVGKLADLVLLDGDPLAAIANTTRIAAVVANGRLLERPALDGLLRAAEQEAATPAA